MRRKVAHELRGVKMSNSTPPSSERRRDARDLKRGKNSDRGAPLGPRRRYLPRPSQALTSESRPEREAPPGIGVLRSGGVAEPSHERCVEGLGQEDAADRGDRDVLKPDLDAFGA